jgi:ATP-dependent protease HslVU (ClpYQ) peptidase subunit
MTCIVGLEHNGEVWMGGDAASVSGSSIVTYRDPKVFHLKSPNTKYDFLIGYTSSFRMGQIIKHSFVPPGGVSALGIEKYLATKFVDALRSLFKRKGFVPDKEEGENYEGGNFLIGHNGHLFEMNEDFHIGSPNSIGDDTFYAVGSGSEVALGALSVTRGAEPKNRCHWALTASAEFCSAVRPPFTVLSL